MDREARWPRRGARFIAPAPWAKQRQQTGATWLPLASGGPPRCLTVGTAKGHQDGIGEAICARRAHSTTTTTSACKQGSTREQKAQPYYYYYDFYDYHNNNNNYYYYYYYYLLYYKNKNKL